MTITDDRHHPRSTTHRAPPRRAGRSADARRPRDPRDVRRVLARHAVQRRLDAADRADAEAREPRATRSASRSCARSTRSPTSCTSTGPAARSTTPSGTVRHRRRRRATRPIRSRPRRRRRRHRARHDDDERVELALPTADRVDGASGARSSSPATRCRSSSARRSTASPRASTSTAPAGDGTVDFKVSSGLARPDYFNWPAELAHQVAALNPQIVVLMLGSNDNQPLLAPDGHTYAFATAGLEAGVPPPGRRGDGPADRPEPLGRLRRRPDPRDPQRPVADHQHGDRAGGGEAVAGRLRRQLHAVPGPERQLHAVPAERRRASSSRCGPPTASTSSGPAATSSPARPST